MDDDYLHYYLHFRAYIHICFIIKATFSCCFTLINCLNSFMTCQTYSAYSLFTLTSEPHYQGRHLSGADVTRSGDKREKIRAVA